MAHRTQWPDLLKKLHSFQSPSIDDLQKYSTANLDPWTVQLGQLLCDRFRFAPLGHRNLANVLHSLPGDQFHQSDFETGFGYHHVLHVLLRTPEGLSLAAITGILAENFHEDFVVDFFTLLAKISGVPLALRPLETQWRRMVKILYGVLATSTFGQVLMAAQDLEADLDTDIDMQSVIQAMDIMSMVTQNDNKKTATILCGSELSFLRAIAIWLFDLKYRIVAGGKVIRSNSLLGSDDEAGITFELSETNAIPSSIATDASPKYRYPADIYVVGGRVPFEGLFKLTFGSLFTTIKNDTLATYLACAARMMHDYLDSTGLGFEFPFLPHDAGPAKGPGFGFINTMMGWFPELHRLSSRFERLSKLSVDETKTRFTESFATLRDCCKCTHCDVNSTTQQEFCTITVVESIVSLGSYVTRMIVQAALYPKIKGGRGLARRLQDARIAKSKSSDPVEDFMDRLGSHLPTSVEMLKMGANLFGVSASKEIDAQTDLMGITHAGLSIYLNGGVKGLAHVEVSDRDRNPVIIRIIPGWMCVFGHEATLEVYTTRSHGWTFEQMWKQVRLQRDVRQIMKWQGSLLLSSLIPHVEKERIQAEAQGWIAIGWD